MPKDPVSPVDAYLAQKPPRTQKVLAQVRRAIARALPRTEEGISYGIPAYKLGTSPVIFFAGWKDHYSIYPAQEALVAAFSRELEPYAISKGTIRFPLDEKVPVALIARLAKFLFAEASARALAKQTRKEAARPTRSAAPRRRTRTESPPERTQKRSPDAAKKAAKKAAQPAGSSRRTAPARPRAS